MSGDPVMGQTCPKCNGYTVVYNGNYFCTHCSWAMYKDVPRIVKAYLLQRRALALIDGDKEEVDRLDIYLINYADDVVNP